MKSRPHTACVCSSGTLLLTRRNLTVSDNDCEQIAHCPALLLIIYEITVHQRSYHSDTWLHFEKSKVILVKGNLSIKSKLISER